MKNIKRLLCILAAFVMLLSMTFPALAQGGPVKIWNAASLLLTGTENVSLTGHATFTYDGEVFKVFDGRYKQDGYKSYMQVVLDTPRKDGTLYTGGYTVVAEDGVTYCVDTVAPQMYSQMSTVHTNTILSNPSVRALLPFGGMIVELAEDRFMPFVTETAAGEGVQYHLNAKGGDLPGALNDALMMIMQLCGSEYLYLDSGMPVQPEPPTGAFYDDYEALFANLYEKSFGEAVPEDLYELLYDENGNSTDMMRRYDLINDMCHLLYQEAEQDHYGKDVAIIMADGTVKLYDTYNAYMIATGREIVNYEDGYEAPFRAWYEKETGAKLSHEEFIALLQTDNAALEEEYNAAVARMENEYLAQLRQGCYCCGLVRTDGTLLGFTDLTELNTRSYLAGNTVTERIFRMTEEMKLDSVDAAAELDKEGRIVSVAGEVAFILTDVFGEQHSLSVDFSGMAFDYGATRVESFDPKTYGVVSAYEYYGGDYSINDVDDWQSAPEIELPEKITFFGKEYTVKVNND